METFFPLFFLLHRVTLERLLSVVDPAKRKLSWGWNLVRYVYLFHSHFEKCIVGVYLEGELA